MTKAAFFLLSNLLLLLMISSCGPAFHSDTVTRKNQPQEQKPEEFIEFRGSLESTTESYNNLTEEVLKKYEKPATEIKTSSATFKLGLTKFTNVEYVYDKSKHQVSIKGHVTIYDSANKIQSEKDFDIVGTHPPQIGVVKLKPRHKSEKSDDIPDVRAKTTCLLVDDDDNLDCSSAVVDFFIAYKKQMLTEQFETKSKSQLKTPPTPKSPSADKKSKDDTAPTTDEKKDTTKDASPAKNSETNAHEPESNEQEGEVESINGRFQGQIQNTDLKDLYSDDDDDQKSPLQPPEPTPPTTKPPEKKEPPVATPPPIKKEDGKKSGSAPGTTTSSAGKAPSQTTSSEPKPAKAEPAKPVQGTDDTTQQPPQPAVEQKPPTTVKPPSPVNVNFTQTTDGKLRQYNQAMGFPYDGVMRNATSLKAQLESLHQHDLFEISFPEREKFYATYEMTDMVARMGQFLNEASDIKLYVSNLSRMKGGGLPGQQSHQTGMDGDFGYPSVDGKTKFPIVVSGGSFNRNAYSTERTFRLFKFVMSQDDLRVDRIFADQKIINDLCSYAKRIRAFDGEDAAAVTQLFQNLQHVEGHGNHFHLRLKCTQFQPACRTVIYTVMNNCSK